MQSFKFEFGDKEHETRVVRTAAGWIARVFLDGIPVNGRTYIVSDEVVADGATGSWPKYLIKDLAEMAQRDFCREADKELADAEAATDEDIAAEIDKLQPGAP